MNSKYVTVLFIVISIGCRSGHKDQNIKVGHIQPAVKEVTPEKNYMQVKNEIGQMKAKLRENWNNKPIPEKSQEFINTVVKKIIPYWYGTKWDFNGTSKTPKQGYIACGYFVTTMLQDAGLSLARNKLAQCASEEMIRTLVNKKYIHQFRNAEMKHFISEIKLQGPGLFIIGLDNHTGFIYHDGQEVYFIHSSYINSIGVVKEGALNSGILSNSKYKITGKISDDENILNRWVEKN